MRKQFVLLTFIAGVLLATSGASAQKAGDMITGMVSDSLGPLEIVNVLERDYMDRISAHAATDENGRFSFKLVNPDDSIEFFFVGYEPVKLKIDRHQFNVTLKPAHIPIVDVVRYRGDRGGNEKGRPLDGRPLMKVPGYGEPHLCNADGAY